MSQSALMLFVSLTISGCGSATPPAAPASAGSESAPAPSAAPAPSSAASASSPAPTASQPAPKEAGASPRTEAPTGGVVRMGEVVAPPSFDPKPTLEVAKPQISACYNQARQGNASLHGKLRLRVNVNEAGAVLSVDAEPGGTAYDAGLVSCIGDAFKLLRFAKPGGMATVTVPLVFHP